MSDTSDTGTSAIWRAGVIGVGVPGLDAPIEGVPVAGLFEAYLAVHHLGTVHAADAMHFGATLMGHLKQRQAPAGSMASVLRMLEDEQPPRDIDREVLGWHVVGFCYLFLRRRLITWEQAAGIATGLLNASPPISAEAWRKKTERWIVRTGRDRVGQRRRKETNG